MMQVPFDQIAHRYDSTFTYSAIGELQRGQVWSYLENILPQLTGLEILELNCGTGEDAIRFGSQGFTIMATDNSKEMLKLTEAKVKQHALQHRITSQYLDLANIDSVSFDKKFDLVFSNFGGLNCIGPTSMKHLMNRLPALLSPGGRFIAVIMPPYCLWASLYSLFTFRFRDFVKRWIDKKVLVKFPGINFDVWYYKPSEIEHWVRPAFSTMTKRPIGLTVPPSYLESFFSRHSSWLSVFNAIDTRLGKLSLLSGLGDHFLIDTKLK